MAELSDLANLEIPSWEDIAVSYLIFKSDVIEMHIKKRGPKWILSMEMLVTGAVVFELFMKNPKCTEAGFDFELGVYTDELFDTKEEVLGEVKTQWPILKKMAADYWRDTRKQQLSWNFNWKK